MQQAVTHFGGCIGSSDWNSLLSEGQTLISLIVLGGALTAISTSNDDAQTHLKSLFSPEVRHEVRISNIHHSSWAVYWIPSPRTPGRRGEDGEPGGRGAEV
jgi:hypothetical protein